MATYKLYKNERSEEINSVFRTDDDGKIWSIPFDPANSDFVEYNKWLALGNKPLPPDEPTLP